MCDIKKNKEYFSWINELKNRYRATQIKAAISVNTVLLKFYWDLGKDISEKYPGKKRNISFFVALSADLKVAIPEAKGLSPTNIKYARYFYELYVAESYRPQLVDDDNEVRHNLDEKKVFAYRPQLVDDNNNDSLFVEQMLAKVPWGHHRIIIDKCGGDVKKALFYVKKTIENSWSRDVLELEIEGDLFSRQGKAVTNFATTLPKVDSDLAQQLTKDPYIFDVQGLTEQYRETELTKAMCENIVRLLNSMGKGFAFVGREYVIEMGGDEFRMDLLFYIIPLHRYFVVEVKNTKFKPEYLGQLQGYIAACDLMLNTPKDEPAIGLLVCRDKNVPLAKYLLGKINMPIGISDYELMRKVPENFKSQLPTVEEIESELANMEKERKNNDTSRTD
ncbi:DUF1016 family protein [bacterium]|nr:DUF1016 family protein [bacterium]